MFPFIQLPATVCGAFSGKWVIPSSSCVCGEELHDPTAWLISDHYPISALHSGYCAFVLAFISIASCTTRRLLTWLWSMRWQGSGRGCPAFWSNAVGVFLTFFSPPRSKEREAREGRKDTFNGRQHGCHYVVERAVKVSAIVLELKVAYSSKRQLKVSIKNHSLFINRRFCCY